MKALLYITAVKCKNYIKSYRYSISKLVLLIILAGFITISLYAKKSNAAARDLSELYSIIFIIYLSVYIIISLQGLRPRKVFFDLADTAYLFVSPIKQRLVLIYGFMKKSGVFLFIGILLLLLLPWFNKLYAISIYKLLVIVLCYIITAVVSGLTAMIIFLYSYNNQSKQKITRVIIVCFCFFAFMLIALPTVVKMLTGKSLIIAVTLSSSAPIISLIPIAGWLQAFTASFFINNKIMMVFYLIPVLIYISACVIIIFKINLNFYEDIIYLNEIKNDPANVIQIINTQVKQKTGLKKGRKTSVFFYKHLVENKRIGRHLFDKFSILYIIIVFIFALLVKKNILLVFGFSVLLSAFSASFKICIKEFESHFIYLIPASVWKKIFYICAQSHLKTAAESFFLFLIIGLIYKLPAYIIIICIFSRISFGFLFITTILLIKKLIKTNINKLTEVILYYATFLLFCLPVIGICALFIGDAVNILQLGYVLIACMIWNVFAVFLIILLGKNILNYA